MTVQFPKLVSVSDPPQIRDWIWNDTKPQSNSVYV